VELIGDGLGQFGGVLNVHVDNVPNHVVHLRWNGSAVVPAGFEFQGITRCAGVTWSKNGCDPASVGAGYRWLRTCDGEAVCGGLQSTITMSDTGATPLHSNGQYATYGGLGTTYASEGGGACMQPGPGSSPPECRNEWGRYNGDTPPPSSTSTYPP
jgi:hypothetical protein